LVRREPPTGAAHQHGRADQPGDQIHDDCGVLDDGDTSGDTWPLGVPTNAEPPEF
jgi:hypothetical protein